MTSRKERSRRAPRILRAAVALAAAALTCSLAASAGDPARRRQPPALQPLDAQNWVDQAELTWDDYTQIRPDAWNDAIRSTGSQNQYKTAVILVSSRTSRS